MPVRPTDLAFFRRRGALAFALLAVIGSWMLLMPPGSGPDEAGHLARAGGVVRGDWDDQRTFTLPDRYQIAEPSCYAFQPAEPASCSFVPVHHGGELDLPSRAGAYPAWGHLWYGAPTLLPAIDPIWWARLAGAAVALALVAAAYQRLRTVSPPLAAGLTLGLTPMAWSTFGTINPSTFVIAGAAAFWASALTLDTAPTEGFLGRRLFDARWLAAVGWAAMVLPRRDGLIWACIALVIALAASQTSAHRWWRTLGRAPQALVAASTLATMVWGALSDTRTTQLVVVAPLIVVAAVGWQWFWAHPQQTTASRLGCAAGALVVGCIGFVGVASTRRGGWNTDLAIDIVNQTDDNLVEAIGVLGWLDTVIPAWAVYMWIFALGMLAARALLDNSRSAIAWAAVLAGIAVTSSWLFELVQGNESGQYWQGRYSLPLIIGIPMLLAYSRTTTHVSDAITRSVTVSGLLILNIAAWAAARRFGVGTSGSLLPWRWDTAIQPVNPLLLLVVHAVATAVLALVLVESQRSVEPGK